MSILKGVEEAKDQLYGPGLGEFPAIRQVHANAAESISGNQITFNMASGEGSAIKAGHFLSSYGATASTGAWVLYVLSVSTDSVTCVHGVYGSPLVTTDDLDGALLEHNAETTEWTLFKKVQTVIDTYLWDKVWKWDEVSFTPDATYGQSDLAADVEFVDQLWQAQAGRQVEVDFYLQSDLPTSVSANGKLLSYDVGMILPGVTMYAKVGKKYTVTDLATEDALRSCVGAGAAALSLDASVAESFMEMAGKDSQAQMRSDVPGRLWRSFLTQREAMADALDADSGQEIIQVIK